MCNCSSGHHLDPHQVVRILYLDGLPKRRIAKDCFEYLLKLFVRAINYFGQISNLDVSYTSVIWWLSSFELTADTAVIGSWYNSYSDNMVQCISRYFITLRAANLSNSLWPNDGPTADNWVFSCFFLDNESFNCLPRCHCLRKCCFVINKI